MAESEVMRVHKRFIAAVKDRQKSLIQKWLDIKKTSPPKEYFSDVAVTKVFGEYYFEEVFGTIPLEKYIDYVERGNKNKKGWKDA